MAAALFCLFSNRDTAIAYLFRDNIQCAALQFFPGDGQIDHIYNDKRGRVFFVVVPRDEETTSLIYSEILFYFAEHTPLCQYNYKEYRGEYTVNLYDAVALELMLYLQCLYFHVILIPDCDVHKWNKGAPVEARIAPGTFSTCSLKYAPVAPGVYWIDTIYFFQTELKISRNNSCANAKDEITLYDFIGLGKKIAWGVDDRIIACHYFGLQLKIISRMVIKRSAFLMPDALSCQLTISSIKLKTSYFNSYLAGRPDSENERQLYSEMFERRKHIIEVLNVQNMTWKQAKRWCHHKHNATLLSLFNTEELEKMTVVLQDKLLYEVQPLIFANFVRNKVSPYFFLFISIVHIICIFIFIFVFISIYILR